MSPASEKQNYYLQTALCVLASSFLIAFAAYCLLEPNCFTIGGVTGIAIMVNHKFGIDQSALIFCINMPLLIVSYFYVKKKFAILTIVNVLLQTIWLKFLEAGFPTIVFPDEGTKIFAAIAAGVCIGASVALALKAGGSTGGIDVIAVIVQKKFSAGSIAQMILLLNSIVIGSSFFVFKQSDANLAINLLPILLSLFEAYIESKANDSITNGFQSAVEFRVITTKPEEMAAALLSELSRGVTAVPATGMYTKQEKGLLLCVISRRQINAFKRIIQRIDPNSFAVLSNVSQVVGLGFYQSEN